MPPCKDRGNDYGAPRDANRLAADGYGGGGLCLERDRLHAKDSSGPRDPALTCEPEPAIGGHDRDPVAYLSLIHI